MLSKEAYREKFKRRFIELVDSSGITKTKCAKEIGISYSTFNRIYTAGTIPRINNIIKIALYFNVSIDYVLLISDDKKVKSKKQIS